MLKPYIDLLTVVARSDWNLDVRGAAACDRVSSATSSRVVKHCVSCTTSSMNAFAPMMYSLSFALLPCDQEETGVSRVADARRDGTLFEGA